ncbi:uncharacterized protein LOC130657047 [Hydractinia symbiolongicarpus]|uniref:uncharacterized protein LOC130653346 n=1 Tax=Hydractinia symbiolongicarpus TaxID=13093 RepID=UPI00254B3DA5|nr:uncharacterized protein LOC130653346 [Hydractinia symbiolongicarpus]XP_057316027.1 uncharacterized protein LOC130657047 [Hydractinia symbiolongicarpus]
MISMTKQGSCFHDKSVQTNPIDSDTRSNIKELLEDFASNTTAHGFAQINLSGRTSTKMFWMLVTLAAYVYLYKEGSSLLKFYKSKPITTNVYFEENEYMDFPDILICNLDPVKEKLKNKFIKEGIEAYKEMHFNDTNLMPFADLRTEDLFRILHYSMVAKYGISAIQSKYLKETLDIKCYYKYYKVDCSSSIKWSSARGNCWLVDLTQEKLRSIDKGSFDGITIKIDLSPNRNSSLEDFTSYPGVDILIQDKNYMFFPGYDGESLAPGYSYNIGLKKKIVKRINRFGNNTCMEDYWVTNSLQHYSPNISYNKAN